MMMMSEKGVWLVMEEEGRHGRDQEEEQFDIIMTNADRGQRTEDRQERCKIKFCADISFYSNLAH